MKYYTFLTRGKADRAVALLSMLLILTISSCTTEPRTWDKKSTEMVAGDYILTHKDQFSEFGQLIEMTHLDALLNIRGPFTILLPTNEAMIAYYTEKGITSLEELSEEQRMNLVKNHIVPAEISASDIGFGALREPNALGDYVATEFHGSDIYVNKVAMIIDQNVKTANGYIHIIDHVLDPLSHTAYSYLKDDPKFSIFAKGLELTGLKDTLDMVDFPYGNKRARNRYTVLAVSDSVFAANNINSVQDLMAWTGGSPDSVTYLKNAFYRYMEYHCLNRSFFLSDLKTGTYPILSRDNNVSIAIEDDYKINFDRQNDVYTAFVLGQSNVPVKNGVVHAVNKLLPVTLPEAYPVTYETTDFIEFKEGDFYGKYYYKWHDGQNSFQKIKFDGDYLLYYYKPNHGRSAILNNDNISLLGFWWVEVTFPKVMKGRYTVSANIWTGGDDLPIFDAYIDGAKVPNSPFNARVSGTKMDFGEVNWKTTEEHKVKLVCVGWGVVFWDSITFTPIKN